MRCDHTGDDDGVADSTLPTFDIYNQNLNVIFLLFACQVPGGAKSVNNNNVLSELLDGN